MLSIGHMRCTCRRITALSLPSKFTSYLRPSPMKRRQLAIRELSIFRYLAIGHIIFFLFHFFSTLFSLYFLTDSNLIWRSKVDSDSFCFSLPNKRFASFTNLLLARFLRDSLYIKQILMSSRSPLLSLL